MLHVILPITNTNDSSERRTVNSNYGNADVQISSSIKHSCLHIFTLPQCEKQDATFPQNILNTIVSDR